MKNYLIFDKNEELQDIIQMDEKEALKYKEMNPELVILDSDEQLSYDDFFEDEENEWLDE